MTKLGNKYDLEERTARFSEEILGLCQKATKTTITLPLIDQLIRSATSIGANYCEANGASSRKDFKNKIFVCKKEAKRRNIGSDYLLILQLNLKKNVEYYGKKHRNSQ